jgi:hypothetical protein
LDSVRDTAGFVVAGIGELVHIGRLYSYSPRTRAGGSCGQPVKRTEQRCLGKGGAEPQPGARTPFRFRVSSAAQEILSLKGGTMHPEDLMKPDLFSRSLLLGSGIVILVALLLIVVAAFTRSAPL